MVSKIFSKKEICIFSIEDRKIGQPAKWSIYFQCDIASYIQNNPCQTLQIIPKREKVVCAMAGHDQLIYLEDAYASICNALV